MYEREGKEECLRMEINVQNSATTYEKYKFEEKGFTKNPQTKPGTIVYTFFII